MSISEKIKAINNKIDQSKAHYNLDKQPAKISDLSSGYVGKYEFLTGKDVLPEKNTCQKKLQQPTDLNMCHQAKNEKHKLVLQQDSIKN